MRHKDDGVGDLGEAVPGDVYEKVLRQGQSLAYNRDELIEVWKRLHLAFEGVLESDVGYEDGSPTSRLMGAIEDSMVPLGNAIAAMRNVVLGLADVTDDLDPDRDMLEEVGRLPLL